MKNLTLDEVIELLTTARKVFGGEIPVQIYNRSGDKIIPTCMDESTIMRGNEMWEEIYFAE